MHRDLKVENLMMKKPGDLNSVKIIDVGLAVKINGEFDEEKHSGLKKPADDEMVKGTPEYMVRPCAAAAAATFYFFWGFFFGFCFCFCFFIV